MRTEQLSIPCTRTGHRLDVRVPTGVIVEARRDGSIWVHTHRTDPNDYGAVERFVDVLARMQRSRKTGVTLSETCDATSKELAERTAQRVEEFLRDRSHEGYALFLAWASVQLHTGGKLSGERGCAAFYSPEPERMILLKAASETWQAFERLLLAFPAATKLSIGRKMLASVQGAPIGS